MAETPTIRRATIEDVPSILGMIKELATYEKALDRVEATESSLSSTLTFAPSPSNSSPAQRVASTFLLCIPSSNHTEPQVVGMGLFFYNYSTWLSVPGVYLEDLYVKPEFRRKGYAKMLLRRLAREACEVSGGRGRLEWSCLKWNESALKFYRGIGAEEMEEWVGLRMEGEGLRGFAGVEKSG